MFKKIQNNLLLRHPLLWNLRIVPLIAVTLIIHLLYFILGYGAGAVNFTETNDYYDFNNNFSGVVIFFGLLLSIFVFIIWMVYYFRNNAYKSFYPKSALSLYKEWLIILLACVLNCTYSSSYLYAKDLRGRNYFSEKEFSRRIDILSMASLFTYGSFERDPDEVTFNGGKRIEIHHTSFDYMGKEYIYTSLINKNITSYSYQSSSHDSLNQMRVKGWLVNNQKDSVLWLMHEFDKIAKSHNLKSSVTPEEWLALTYNYPGFSKYKDIRHEDKFPASNFNKNNIEDYENTAEVVNPNEAIIDSTDYTFSSIKGSYYAFPKYYVPQSILYSAYNTISNSWSNPDPGNESILIQLYLALGLAMAMFSFRVTSGRDWLIALVATGVTGMATGIFSIFGGEKFFQFIWVIIPVASLIGFIATSMAKTTKGKSAIVLNAVLWLSIGIIPLLQLIIIDILRPDIDYSNVNVTVKDADIARNYPVYTWLNGNTEIIMALNILFIIAIMYWLTIAIKRWKGLPEA